MFYQLLKVEDNSVKSCCSLEENLLFAKYKLNFFIRVLTSMFLEKHWWDWESRDVLMYDLDEENLFHKPEVVTFNGIPMDVEHVKPFIYDYFYCDGQIIS